MSNFDPNSPAVSKNIFGLPYTPKNAKIIIIPMPWEVTVSFNKGTAQGPEQILEASYQVDLFDQDVKDAWKIGIAMEEVDKTLKEKSKKLRKKAEKYIDAIVNQRILGKEELEIVSTINKESKKLNNTLKEKALKYLKNGKLVVALGGDHSTPLGLMQAISETHKTFSVLHIDAHFDLRKAYEGFEYSHASIFYNASKIKNLDSIVHVGIRDFCEEEVEYAAKNKKSVTFYDQQLSENAYKGKNWDTQCNEIIKKLKSDKVYISFDIDGLDPKLCPGTGTPVPGGLEYMQSIYLIKKLTESGKKIVGFDLNEVSSNDETNWNGNVGARLLYKICNLMAKSNKLA